MNLLIVESPSKTRKIQGYLGRDWRVMASRGHIRDLPSKGDELPAKYKDAPFASLGVDVENHYTPIYVTRPDKAQLIHDLKAAALSANEVYLGADSDREGESIAWHLSVLLGLGQDAKRVRYQEITERAIRQAIAHPRTIDLHLVAAQETRRILDRLAGYGVSPLLWKAVGGPQSAGRVQSAALMLLAQREQARLSFVASGFWRVGVKVLSQPPFAAMVSALRDVPLASAASFTPQGQLKPGLNVAQLDRVKAAQLTGYLNRQQAQVSSVEVSPTLRKPPPPLTTSGMQQAASAKLRLGAAQVTKLAQGLYEQGLVTYIRTDSTHLSEEAITLAREAVAVRFGPAALPAKGRQYAVRSQNAQEAHEAIRPAGKFALPEQTGLGGDELALYTLIYERTLASQMKDALGEKTTLTLQAGQVTLSASGVVLTERGFTALYDDEEKGEEEQRLPKLKVGERFPLIDARAEEKKSSPPPRFTEGKFVQVMEKAGIGRPSTFGATLEVLQRRGYAALRNRQLHVTPLGLLIASYLHQQMPDLVNTGFTAQMEHDLDRIAAGTLGRVACLDSIWKDRLGPAIHNAALSAPRFKLPHLGAVLEVRGGVAGVVRGGKGAALPDDLLPEDMTERIIDAVLGGIYQAGMKKAKTASRPRTSPKAAKNPTPSKKATTKKPTAAKVK